MDSDSQFILLETGGSVSGGVLKRVPFWERVLSRFVPTYSFMTRFVTMTRASLQPASALASASVRSLLFRETIVDRTPEDSLRRYRSQEFIFFDLGGDSHARTSIARLHAKNSRRESDADCFRQRDVRRQSQRDLYLRSRRDWPVDIEEYPACADVLSFGEHFLKAVAS
jgi:hypothetical protein